MNNKYKNFIYFGMAFAIFGFASLAYAGPCDNYKVVATCMSAQGGPNYNNYGSDYGNSAQSNYGNTTQPNPNDYKAPQVFTKNASSTTSSSINMVGNVSTSTPSAVVFFQYGPTPNLGYESIRRSVGPMNSEFNTNVTGLQADTIYYYRIVAENPNGGSVGGVVSAKTDVENNGFGFFNSVTLKKLSSNSNTTTEKSTTTNETDTSDTTVNKTTNVTTNTTDNTNKNSNSNNDSSNGLSALSMFGENQFLPDTIFEWILVIILIFLIILMLRLMRPKESHTVHAPAHH